MYTTEPQYLFACRLAVFREPYRDIAASRDAAKCQYISNVREDAPAALWQKVAAPPPRPWVKDYRHICCTLSAGLNMTTLCGTQHIRWNLCEGCIYHVGRAGKTGAAGEVKCVCVCVALSGERCPCRTRSMCDQCCSRARVFASTGASAHALTFAGHDREAAVVVAVWRHHMMFDYTKLHTVCMHSKHRVLTAAAAAAAAVCTHTKSATR